MKEEWPTEVRWALVHAKLLCADILEWRLHGCPTQLAPTSLGAKHLVELIRKAEALMPAAVDEDDDIGR